jgi:hypothetical protein
LSILPIVKGSIPIQGCSPVRLPIAFLTAGSPATMPAMSAAWTIARERFLPSAFRSACPSVCPQHPETAILQGFAVSRILQALPVLFSGIRPPSRIAT